MQDRRHAVIDRCFTRFLSVIRSALTPADPDFYNFSQLPGLTSEQWRLTLPFF